MKTFHKTIKKENLYKEYVLIINGLLQLSFREAEVFSLLLRLNDELSSFIHETSDILSTDIRRIIMRETRISKTNLVKYINTLASKDVILKDEEGRWKINDTFVFSSNDKLQGPSNQKLNEISFILDTQ